MRADALAPRRRLADMMDVRILLVRLCALVLSLAVCTTSAYAQTSASATREAALQHVRGTTASKSLAITDVSELVVTDETRTQHAGVSHVYIRQGLGGIEIANQSVTVNLDAKNLVIGTRGSLVRDILTSATATSPTLSASGAIDRAAAQLGLVATAPLVELESSTGPTQASLFRLAGVSLDDIPVKLTYYSLPSGALVLAWELVVRTPDRKHWWQVWVDATTGAITAQGDWIARDSYRVLEIPVESPQHGVRTLAVDPADATASPFGWHDTNGAAGAEFNITRGNNVLAQEDQNGNNGTGYGPNGGAALVFDYSLDLAQAPSVSLDAGITNLFYWNNVLHDVLYQYGFDEQSGNFQSNNYGAAGVAGDDVLADAQDGSDFDNANFGTPPDGSQPRMQMFLWSAPATPLLAIGAPSAAAGSYTALEALFGGSVPASPASVLGSIVVVDDGSGAASEGCGPLINGPAISGNVALIDRGNCNFTVKVKNAQNVGALAVVMVNNVLGSPITMGGTDGTVTIPSVMVSRADGTTIRTALPAGATLSNPGQGPNIDSGFDAGIVAHEYCHGLSNRLTGGPANSSCLFNDEQPGEGWSDFCGLFLTATPGDAGSDARPVGTYAAGQSVSGSGIRVYPYSTDLAINPHTYDDIKTASIPHGVGSVWAVALWDMYWNLVDTYGYDANLYTGTGGNNLAMQLVVDGLKLQTCSPSFLDARDAILQADVNANAGANECLIWQAFAKRGMGVAASAGSSNSVIDGFEDFTIPSQCLCGNGVADAGEACDEGGETATCNADCSVPLCSNGVVELNAGEQCDDANANDNDDCTNACLASVCGDTTLWNQGTGSEACDEGGETATCNADCSVPSCSNGVFELNAGEQCDDGNANANDDCTNVCVAAVCGDSTVWNQGAGSEACDEGGETATCNADCSVPFCSNGVVELNAGEQCDDGGLDQGDGCSATCQFEVIQVPALSTPLLGLLMGALLAGGGWLAHARAASRLERAS